MLTEYVNMEHMKNAIVPQIIDQFGLKKRQKKRKDVVYGVFYLFHANIIC